MNNKALKIINPILLLLVLLILVGLVIYKVTESNLGRELHEISGILFVAVGLLHLSINWGWVRATYLKKKNSKKQKGKSSKK